MTCLKILQIRKKYKGQKKKEQEYLDRLEVRKQLLELLEQRQEKVNYEEKVIVGLIEFVINILVVPKQLEKKFEQEFYQSFIEKKASMQLSEKGRKYADYICAKYYGETMEKGN